MFVATAVAGSPGTTEINDEYFEDAFEEAQRADSWAGRAIEDWSERATEVGDEAIDPEVAERVEDERGAPATSGWN